MRKEPSLSQPDWDYIFNLEGSNINIHAPRIINANPEYFRATTFGMVPAGSFLSYQCPLMPPDFKVYCNIENMPSNMHVLIYPKFPFTTIDNAISNFEKEIAIVEWKKIQVLQKLKIEAKNSIMIEEMTRDQASNPCWFEHRKNRFTASLCNRLTNQTGPKTDRGFSTLAHNIIHRTEFTAILKAKMEYGKYYEPIAIKHYEQYMKLSGFDIYVEPSGLVIDGENYILGATPDGKVICNREFGILEVKCTDQY